MSTAKDNTLKIRIISDHPEYKKDQTYDLKEKAAIPLLTNGKAIRIHRENNEQIDDQAAKEAIDKVIEKSDEKPKLKTKKE